MDLLRNLLGANLLRNLLTGKGVKRSEVIRVGEGTIRAGQNFYCHHIF